MRIRRQYERNSFGIFVPRFSVQRMPVNPFIFGGGGGGGGGNIVPDIWQDFSGTISSAGLAATDHHAVSVSWTFSGNGTGTAGAQMAVPLSTVNGSATTGSQGFEMDNNTGSGNCQFSYTTPSSSGADSFMWRETAMTDGVTDPTWGVGSGTGVNAICEFKQARSGSTYTLALYGNTTSGNITVSINTAYWIAIKYVQNSTCALSVYNTSGVQVGSEVTCVGRNVTADTHFLFTNLAASSTGVRQVDNWVSKDGGTVYLGP